MDFSNDIAKIIEDWDTLVTQKRNSLTYNDRGEAINNWATVVTAYINIQPISSKDSSNMQEIGQKEIYTHMLYGYYDTNSTKLTVYIGDRFYDASNKIYEVGFVREFENSHFEIYCVYVEGKI